MIAWLKEPASLPRARRIAQLDVEYLAEEIEVAGQSEQRELVSRVIGLLAHALQWPKKPDHRGASWRITIREPRSGIAYRLPETPGVCPRPADSDWRADLWDDAAAHADEETWGAVAKVATVKASGIDRRRQTAARRKPQRPLTCTEISSARHI